MVFAKQNFILQIRQISLISQMSLIRQNSNKHKRENGHGVKMIISKGLVSVINQTARMGNGAKSVTGL